MKISTHLVISRSSGKPRVRRVTQKRPVLYADEALIRLELEIPEDAFEAPLFTVQVEKTEIEVAVEALAVEA